MLQEWRATIRPQCSLSSCNYHRETAENGHSCVRPQLSDGSINRDSLWASGPQQSWSTMPICFQLGNTWSGQENSPDVQHSEEETEWPFSFLWGTMAGNNRAWWTSVRTNDQKGVTSSRPAHPLSHSLGFNIIVHGLLSAVNTSLVAITLHFIICKQKWGFCI